MEAWLAITGSPPVVTFKRLTEISDDRVTEAGDNRVTE
jgi:hypothetical protein